MTTLQKTLIFVGIFLLFTAIGFIIYFQIHIANRQDAIEAQTVKQKELPNNITRSENSYVKKEDLEAFLKQNNVQLDDIKKDLKKLGADIKLANNVVVTSIPQYVSNIPTTIGSSNPNPIPIPKECKNLDEFGYLNKQQNLSLNEKFENANVPFGTVGFSSWKKEPWNIDIKKREYSVTSVVGEDENQRHYFYNKFQVKVDNKSYELKINQAETKEIYPEPKFYFWNPHLYLSAGAGLNSSQMQGNVNLGLLFSVMSYGKYKTSPDISVLQVGAGYDFIEKKPNLIIAPISFNIGKLFPKNLVNNTFIGPTMNVGLSGSISFNLSLNVGF